MYNKEVTETELFCGVAQAIQKVKPELKPEVKDTGGGIVCLSLKQDNRWILVGEDNGNINWGSYKDEDHMDPLYEEFDYNVLPVKVTTDFSLVAVSLLYSIDEIGINDLKGFEQKMR